MISLEKLTQEVQDLAPLPAAAAKLARVISEKEPVVSEVVMAIRFDQALTATVLRYANSPMAGALYRIRNVKDAVVRLGFAKVLEIAVGSHVRGPMQTALPQYGLDEDELWYHSVAAALAAEALQRRAARRLPPTSFTAALLHDIGKLILARHLDAGTQAKIRACTQDYGMTYYQAELEVLAFSHADLGARIAERWGLGEEIVSAVAAHHHLDEPDNEAADVVRICNLAAKTVGRGLGFEGMNLAGDPAACQRLGVGREAFEGLCAEVATSLVQFQDWAA